MNAPASGGLGILKQLAPLVLAIGIWFAPIPEGLTREAWQLFAIFAAAIFAVIINALPLLTSALLAGAAAVLSETVDPAKVFGGFANPSVLLVVVAFLVAQAVVKCGLGTTDQPARGDRFRQIDPRPGLQHLHHRRPDRSRLSEQHGARRRALPDHSVACPEQRLASRGREQAPPGRLPDVLRHGQPQRLVGAVADRHLGQSDRRLAGGGTGLQVSFGSWLLVASVPALAAIGLLPLLLYRLFPPGVTATPDAPHAAREALRAMGRCRATSGSLPSSSRHDLRLDPRRQLQPQPDGGGHRRARALLATRVLTLDDIYLQGGTWPPFSGWRCFSRSAGSSTRWVS
jgi:DASS family divalent anion:Na+ symporter